MSAAESFPPLDRIVSPLTVVRRERRLPGPGQLLLGEGARVEPQDVVGEAATDGGLHVVDGAALLGVAPRKVAGLLGVSVGDGVAAGQVVAQRGGLLRRALAAPVDGTLRQVDGAGRLVFQARGEPQPVRALWRGQIVSVAAGEGVTIEAQGALLQGAWGNGQADHGLLRLMVPTGDATVPAHAINAGVRGTILIAGATMDAETLERARAAQVRGLVLGSLDAALLPLARALPFPLLLTEGFGALPIGAAFFGLLQSLNGREATLDGRWQPRGPRIVPELFVPLGGAASASPSPGPLAVGDRVRVLGAPHAGQLGTVQSAQPTRHTLPSGLVAPACAVLLDGGTRALVPLSNLERLVP